MSPPGVRGANFSDYEKVKAESKYDLGTNVIVFYDNNDRISMPSDVEEVTTGIAMKRMIFPCIYGHVYVLCITRVSFSVNHLRFCF